MRTGWALGRGGILLVLVLQLTAGLQLRGRVAAKTTVRQTSSRMWMGGLNPSWGAGEGSLRIKIQGTTNAYTTLRGLDVVLYGLSPEIEGKSRALGYFKGDTREIVPLCNRDAGSSEFFRDQTQAPLSADKLKENDSLLRVVSSDRRSRDECFIIEEYLDSDIHIPVVAEGQVSGRQRGGAEAPAPVASRGAGASSFSFSDLQEKLIAAQMQMQLVQTQLLDMIKSAEQTGASSGVNQEEFSEVKTTLAPSPVGPYSQAVRTGNLVFLSGSLGLDPVTGKLADGGIIFEAGQALTNIEAILEASGSSRELVVKTTILLKEISDSKIVNNIYQDFFSGNPFLPARTTYAVADLPLGAKIEIEVVATVRNL